MRFDDYLNEESFGLVLIEPISDIIFVKLMNRSYPIYLMIYVLSLDHNV